MDSEKRTFLNQLQSTIKSNLVKYTISTSEMEDIAEILSEDIMRMLDQRLLSARDS